MIKTIKRAIIVGAGIGGLCSAIALKQQGVDCIVYEQAEKLSQVGAGLTLWANAIKALRRLGVADQVIETGAKIERGQLRTESGRVLSRSQPGELEQLFGEPTVAIHRADLHDILLSVLPIDMLQLGAKCVGFQQEDDNVIVNFENGHSDQADLLIGADGIHSLIRQQLLPEVKLRYSGYTAWRGVVTSQDEAALGTTSESWGRGMRFGIVRIDRERIYWFATANRNAGIIESPSLRKAGLIERFKNWHAPIPSLITSIPESEILHNDIYDIEPLSQWGRGRVILLGDAIHPTTPNLGQGACMAIESSVVLVRALVEEETVSKALQRYQQERMPRTSWITEQSWQVGRVGQYENPIACALRNLLVSVTPDSVMKKTLAKAVGYEI